MITDRWKSIIHTPGDPEAQVQEMTKATAMTVKDKMIMFWGTVPSKVAGFLLYTVEKKSLQHQTSVKYLIMSHILLSSLPSFMPIRLRSEDRDTLIGYKKA